MTHIGSKSPTNNDQSRVASDTNHNGVIDANERNGQCAIFDIQIHAERSGGPTSIGCQTIPPNDYNQLQNSIREASTGNEREFTDLLVHRGDDILVSL